MRARLFGPAKLVPRTVAAPVRGVASLVGDGAIELRFWRSSRCSLSLAATASPGRVNTEVVVGLDDLTGTNGALRRDAGRALERPLIVERRPAARAVAVVALFAVPFTAGFETAAIVPVPAFVRTAGGALDILVLCAVADSAVERLGEIARDLFVFASSRLATGLKVLLAGLVRPAGIAAPISAIASSKASKALALSSMRSTSDSTAVSALCGGERASSYASGSAAPFRSISSEVMLSSMPCTPAAGA